MVAKALVALLATGWTLSSAVKPAPVARAANSVVDVQATLFTDREAIKQLLGSDLGGYYVVIEIKLAPKGKLPVWRDDFLLRTDRDGEKSKPYSPSQIAGRGVLVVSQTGAGSVMADNQGPVWGGYPTGRPGRMGGDGGMIGNSGGVSTRATVDSGAKQKENPLMAVLTEKVLPEKETEEPVSGLLFFPLEPKQKAKDLELFYSTSTGKIALRFR